MMASLEWSQVDGTYRPRMVGSVVHQALSQILQYDIADPRIARTTITEVELSKDLKHVTVFLTSVESSQALQTSVEHLNRATAYIRRCLSSQLNLRFTPSIRFMVDDLPVRTARVLQLIDDSGNANTPIDP